MTYFHEITASVDNAQVADFLFLDHYSAVWDHQMPWREKLLHLTNIRFSSLQNFASSGAKCLGSSLMSLSWLFSPISIFSQALLGGAWVCYKLICHSWRHIIQDHLLWMIWKSRCNLSAKKIKIKRFLKIKRLLEKKNKIGKILEKHVAFSIRIVFLNSSLIRKTWTFTYHKHIQV